MKALKICEFNVENLFVSLEYYQGEDLDSLKEPAWKDFALPQLRKKQKPLKKLWGLSRAMLDINADVFLLVEVGGPESLRNFNHHFLKDRYDAYFLDGNSSRAIDLAYLVKKGLPFEVEALSNRHLPVEVKSYQGNYKAKFSRDVAELRLQRGGKLELLLLLTHLKSKISSDQDFKGNEMRAAEAAALASLYNKRRSEFPETPIVVGGDFNSDLESAELTPLRQTDLQDFQAILQRSRPARTTYVHFDYQDKAHYQTLDYLLVSPHLKTRVKEGSSVYLYKTFYDLADPLPDTWKERFRQPSDHFPLVLELEMP